MSDVLVFCERDDVAFEILSSAPLLKGMIYAVVLGHEAKKRAQLYFNHGAEKVYVSEHPHLQHFNAEVYADVLKKIAEENKIDTIFLGSTRRGRELAPRVAAMMDASCITDATGFDENFVFWRYTLGGNTVEKLKPTQQRKVVSFLPKTFVKAENKTQGEVIEITFEPKTPRIRIIEEQQKVMGQANIEDAERIVGVGRGIAKKEDLAMVSELAVLLNAEVGCTRPLASDFGWLTEDRIIGLSGKKSKPKFYLAIGVSGQIQHTVGIRDAKIIAAIDKNKDAPIFRMADYGIVGDLYVYLPLLIERLKRD